MTTDPSAVGLSARLRRQAQIGIFDAAEEGIIVDLDEAADLIDSQAKRIAEQDEMLEADEIVLASRDAFIISTRQWDAFVQSLPDQLSVVKAALVERADAAESALKASQGLLAEAEKALEPLANLAVPEGGRHTDDPSAFYSIRFAEIEAAEETLSAIREAAIALLIDNSAKPNA